MLSDTEAEELLKKQSHSLDSLYYENKDDLAHTNSTSTGRSTY